MSQEKPVENAHTNPTTDDSIDKTLERLIEDVQQRRNMTEHSIKINGLRYAPIVVPEKMPDMIKINKKALLDLIRDIETQGNLDKSEQPKTTQPTSSSAVSEETEIKLLWLTHTMRDSEVKCLYKCVNEIEVSARIDELSKLEPLTHEGRGTILWEIDTIATDIKKRLSELTNKDKEK